MHHKYGYRLKDKPNTLYVAVSLRNIKTDGIVTVRDVKNVAQIAPPSEIRLSEFSKTSIKKI